MAIMSHNEFIKSTRTMQKLTRFDIERISGVSNSTLFELENGKNTIRLDKLHSIANSLGIKIILKTKTGECEVEL